MVFRLPQSPSANLRPWPGWARVLLPALIAQLLVAHTLLTKPLAGFSADDEIHAVYGAALLHDLARGDARSAGLDLWDQVRWPPLGSVLQLPGLMVFGVSEEGHRLAILLWLLPAAAVLAAGALALQRRRRSRWLAAGLAAAFLVTSRTALAAAGGVLYEVPGVAAMIAAYWAAHHGWTARRRRYLLLAGGLLAAAWFLKWQYGILGTVALGSAALVWWRSSERGKAPVGAPWLFGPSVALVGLWLASPYHVREFVMYLIWRPASPGKLTAHAAALVEQFVAGDLLGQALSCLVAVGLVLALPLVRRPLGVALLLHVLIAAAASLGKDFSMRTALWVAMPAWVLAAAGWADLASRLSPRGLERACTALAAVAAVGAVVAALGVGRYLVDRGQHPGLWFRQEARYLAESVPFRAKLLTAGGWWRFISPYHVRWHGLQLHWAQRFALRDLPVADWPNVEWEPWRLRWTGLRAVMGLRGDAPRPERRRDPPDYVAALYLPDGCPDVDEILSEIGREFTLVRLSERKFDHGSRVVLYRCLGKAPQTPRPARRGP